MARQPEFDIVVHGATGFTGQLIAEYVAGIAADQRITFALSGRSIAKLEAVRNRIEGGLAVPLIQADSADPASLDAMVARGPHRDHRGGPLSALWRAAGGELRSSGYRLSRSVGRGGMDAQHDRSL